MVPGILFGLKKAECGILLSLKKEGMRVDPEDIMLSEVSQSAKSL